MGSTRSLGTPASAHLDTPCGEIGGVKIDPTAAYDPMARQIRSKAKGVGTLAELVESVMVGSINRQLTEINCQLLPQPLVVGASFQPMVEKSQTMVERLKELKGSMSYVAFGALAGKTGQAAYKWFHGGNVEDSTLRALVSKEPYKSQGVTVEWIRYGKIPEPKGSAAPTQLSMAAMDIARRWMALTPERQDMIRDLIHSMSFLEENFPSMRKRRPKNEHYSAFEAAMARDMPGT